LCIDLVGILLGHLLLLNWHLCLGRVSLSLHVLLLLCLGLLGRLRGSLGQQLFKLFLCQLNKCLLLGRSRLSWLLVDLSILNSLRLRLSLGLFLTTNLNESLICLLLRRHASNLGSVQLLGFRHLLTSKFGNIVNGSLCGLLSLSEGSNIVDRRWSLCGVGRRWSLCSVGR